MSATGEDKRPELEPEAADTSAEAHDDTQDEAKTAESPIVKMPKAEHTEVKVEPPEEDWDAESLAAFETLEERRKKRQRKRIIRLAILAALIIAGAVAVVLNTMNADEETEEVVPEIASVERRDFEVTVSSDGALEPKSSTIVTPEVGGVIENLDVVVGQNVKKGDTLFTLKNEQLDKDVADAERAVTTSERALDKARRDRDKEWATYNKNFDEYERALRSEEGEAAEAPEAPDDETLLSGIEDAELDLQEKREAYDAAVEKAGKRTVTAPETGAVLTVNAVNGMSIEEGGSPANSDGNSGPLVQIVDVSTMKVTIDVDESDITKLKTGQPARVTFAAVPDLELEAKVVEIATAAGSGDGSSFGGEGSASFSVKLEIPEPDKRLKPGMTASVTIITQSVPDALVVPTATLDVMEEADEGGTGLATAEVVTDEETYETETRDVVIGLSDGSETVVVEGLEEGDMLKLPDFGTDLPEEGDELGGEEMEL